MNDKRQKVYSQEITVGRRTYLFDVKMTRDGSKYLTITEIAKTNSYPGRTQIMVFEDHLEEFLSTLEKAAEFLNWGGDQTNKTKSTHISKIRQEYPNAYKAWTSEEDELLERSFCSGIKIEQLSKIFRRQPGAIRSRLNKLGFE